MRSMIPTLFLILPGCALMPDAIIPEVEHMSHLTQHRPFTSAPQNYNAEILNIAAAWRAQGWEFEVAEGVCLNPMYASTTVREASCGELFGPNREQFTARIRYVIPIPKE